MEQVTKTDHYAEAERVITVATSYIDDQKAYGEFAGWTRAELLALAQVHATLANAAANRSQAEGDNRAADAETEQAAALTRLGTTVANGEGGNTGRLMTAVGR